MAWTANNDPWFKSGSKKVYKPWSANIQGCKTVGDTSLLDPKATQVAQLLMSINARESTQRQCAAANTSAIFNLLMGSSGPKNLNKDEAENCKTCSCEVLPPSVRTAHRLQRAFSKHAGKEFGTLAKAMKTYRQLLPSTLKSRVDEVNKVGSYDRHQTMEDEELICEVGDFLASYRHENDKGGTEDKNRGIVNYIDENGNTGEKHGNNYENGNSENGNIAEDVPATLEEVQQIFNQAFLEQEERLSRGTKAKVEEDATPQAEGSICLTKYGIHKDEETPVEALTFNFSTGKMELWPTRRLHGEHG